MWVGLGAEEEEEERKKMIMIIITKTDPHSSLPTAPNIRNRKRFLLAINMAVRYSKHNIMCVDLDFNQLHTRIHIHILCILLGSY